MLKFGNSVGFKVHCHHSVIYVKEKLLHLYKGSNYWGQQTASIFMNQRLEIADKISSQILIVTFWKGRKQAL